MAEHDNWQNKPDEGEFSARRSNGDHSNGNSFNRPRRNFSDERGGFNRSGNNSFGKPARSFDRNENSGNQSFERSGRQFGEDRNNRFENRDRSDNNRFDNRFEKPARRFNNDGAPSSDRPRRDFNQDSNNADRPRRSFQNDGGNSFDRPRRSFSGDGNRSNDGFRRNDGFRSNDANRSREGFRSNDGEQRGFGKPRRSFNDQNSGNSFDRSYNKSGSEDAGNKFDRPRRSFNQDGDKSFDRSRRSFDSGEGGYRPRFNGPSIPKADRADGRPRRPRIQKPGSSFDHGKPYGMHSAPNYPIFFDPDATMRLNKFLANAGLCSRREADEFIQAGVVKVNGETVTELGVKVKASDTILFHDQAVSIEHKIYILLNKPKDCVTTSDDPQERTTVLDLVKGACAERIYPVGRLDRNTTGVLLLTNDGDLASKLTHPKFEKRKIYQATLDKDISYDDIQKILDGIQLEDCEVRADNCSLVSEDMGNVVGIEIHTGQNRVIRRIFESLGYKVYKLDRVYFAGLTKKNLPRGKWRHLTEKEVSLLKMGAFV